MDSMDLLPPPFSVPGRIAFFGSVVVSLSAGASAINDFRR